MTKLSIYVGIALIVLGIAAYIITGAASVTALIPTFFGLAFAGLGILGEKSESMRKHSMHAAILLAILGLGGSFTGLVNAFGVLGGQELERPVAAYSQAIMALICIFFIIAGIRSFLEARKNPKPDTRFENEG